MCDRCWIWSWWWYRACSLGTSGIVLDDLRGSWIKAESAALAFNYKLNHGPTSSCVNSSSYVWYNCQFFTDEVWTLIVTETNCYPRAQASRVM